MAGTGPPPTSKSSLAASADSFGECLKLLKGPSDEHRFVGLLFLAKTLQNRAPSQDSNVAAGSGTEANSTDGGCFGIKDARKLIFEALGGDFLRRLFVATPPGGNEKATASQTYRDLALVILSYLFEDQEVAKTFLDINDQLLSHFCSVNARNREETAQCLVALCRANPTIVTKALASSLNTTQALAAELKSSASSHTSKVCAMYLLTQLCRSDSKGDLQQPDAKACVEALSIAFATITESSLVFDAMAALALFFENGSNALEATSPGKSGWEDFIHEGLFRMMRNKIPMKHRPNLFRLLNYMVSSQQSSWCISRGLARANRKPSDFCVLMAKLVMIESRVNSDDIARVVVDDGSKDKAAARKSLDTMASCYGIVEHSVVHLLATEEDSSNKEASMMWKDLPAGKLLMLRDSFVDVVNASLDIVDYAGKALKANGCSFDGPNLGLVEALSVCFRLISTWMSVDAGSILDHVLNIIGSLETIVVHCEVKGPSRNILEYCLPTVAIVIDDFGAREDFDKTVLVPKLREFEAMIARSYENAGHRAEGLSDQSLREMGSMLKHVLQVLEY